MIRILLLALLGIFLTGCTTMTPAATAYTLTPSSSSISCPLIPQSSASLKLAGTQTAPSLSTKALLYLTDHQEIGAYLYSRWNDTPGSMIDRYIASSLDENQVFSSLIPKTSSLQGDLVLESSLSSFYHRIHEDKTSDGYLDITYILVDQKNKKMVAHKRFVITVPAKSLDAKGGATALNETTHELANQSIAWLTMIIKENKWIK